jgi:hypothetical protein
VLVHPPAVAHPDQQVARHQAGDLAGPAGAEHLPVRQVVGDKTELREGHRHQRGDAELPPGVAEQEERGPGRGVDAAHQAEAHHVVARATVQQAGRGDPPVQAGEVATGRTR